MLVKAFELINEFPFEMPEGTLLIDSEQLIPTSINRGAAHLMKRVHTIKPGLTGRIKLYGLTYGQDTMKMVCLSNEHATRYYWFTRKRTYTYLVQMASRDLDEAWLNLFKAIMMDSRPSALTVYEIVKHFIMEYFKTLGDREFKVTLSGKWKKEFAHVEFERESFIHKSVFVTVGDERRLCDLNKHPLLEMIG